MNIFLIHKLTYTAHIPRITSLRIQIERFVVVFAVVAFAIPQRSLISFFALVNIVPRLHASPAISDLVSRRGSRIVNRRSATSTTKAKQPLESNLCHLSSKEFIQCKPASIYPFAATTTTCMFCHKVPFRSQTMHKFCQPPKRRSLSLSLIERLLLLSIAEQPSQSTHPNGNMIPQLHTRLSVRDPCHRSSKFQRSTSRCCRQLGRRSLVPTVAHVIESGQLDKTSRLPFLS